MQLPGDGVGVEPFATLAIMMILDARLLFLSQHAMGSVADWLIDHYTGEAIKDKIVEERNYGRASGSGEFGADLWVEAMVRTVKRHSFSLFILVSVLSGGDFVVMTFYVAGSSYFRFFTYCKVHIQKCVYKRNKIFKVLIGLMHFLYQQVCLFMLGICRFCVMAQWRCPMG